MADGSFRPLTAKEIRKHIERRGEDKQSQQMQKRSDDDDVERSDNLGRKNEDDWFCDRKYGRKRRSVEQHSDSRHRSDRHYDRGRETDLIIRERSSELSYSRERSRDQYSSKEREVRYNHRGRHHNESDSKQHRSNKPSYERNRAVRRNRSICRHSPEDSEDGSSDRPAWATKAVVKRAEEIQKRKLIWSKPEEKKDWKSNTVSSLIGLRPSTTSTWNSILAASSSDSKQLDKFKRLMGMKKSDEEGQEEVPKVDDNQIEAERRRQRELYSHLDHQYAVARSFTHLSRGQGLGFHQ
uniref:Small acidic protein-like domain-containing protein n=2 Tax=Wuchereria bancrofti TaxID=6293 RepID=A0AAF5PPV7_WUCBA